MAEPVGPFAQHLPDAVKLGRDRAKPLVLIAPTFLVRDGQKRRLLPDKPLDPREQPQLVGIEERSSAVRGGIPACP